MITVRALPEGIAQLRLEKGIARELGVIAGRYRDRVRAPSHLLVYARQGVGPRGAFSQVVMAGRGAVAIEFGTRTRRPSAPLRRAIAYR